MGAVHVSPSVVIIHRFLSWEQVGRFARMAGRVCVVIGVGPGLGMSCVRQWVKEGYKVAMVSRTASKLEAAAAENPGTLAVAADVTNPASLTAALTTVEQKLGEIHTVVYNAGLGVWATYENVTHEKLEMSMKTNVHGLLTVAQHVGPKMTARGGSDRRHWSHRCSSGEADDCWICHRQGSPENAHAVFGTRPWSEGNSLLLRHRRRWHRSSERGPRTERIKNGSGCDRG